MHVHHAPVAVFLVEYHGRARDEVLVLVPLPGPRIIADPACHARPSAEGFGGGPTPPRHPIRPPRRCRRGSTRLSACAACNTATALSSARDRYRCGRSD